MQLVIFFFFFQCLKYLLRADRAGFLCYLWVMVRRKTAKILVLCLDEWEPITYMGKYLQMCLASPTGSQEFHPLLPAVS